MSAEREFDPRVIALVAARYRELQGLRTCADGAALVCLGGVFRFTDDRLFDTSRWAIGADVVLFAAVAAYVCLGRRRIERYYESRFGRVDPRAFVLPFALHFSVYTSWMALWCAVPGPVWVRGPLAWAAAVFVIGWPGWIAKRDAPLRWAWALVAVAAVVASLQLPIDHPEARYVWRGAALLYGGVALMIAGAFDHAILVRALGRGQAGDAVHA